MAKDVGAKKVIVASCAPPIRYCNVYGIDMPSRSELVAHDRTTEEVAKYIGADLVIFQTLDDLVKSVRGLNPSIPQFDCSVFTGEYVTGGIDDAYLDHIEKMRGDPSRTAEDDNALPDIVDNAVDGAPPNGDATIGLHNKWTR